MARKATGDPTEYDSNDAAALEAKVDEAWAEYEAQQEREHPTPRFGEPGEGPGPVERRRPGRLRISAEIEWAGTYNSNPYRTTTLDGLDLARLAPAITQARRANRDSEQAQPLRSYRAKGWHAQIRELTRTQKGREAAARAGLAPTGRTLTNWLSETTAPRKKDRERIARAYESVREKPVTRARESRQTANKELSQALSEVVRDRYGVEVRFFNIGNIEIHD